MNPSPFRSRLLLLFYGALFSVPLSVNWLSEQWHFGMLMVSEPLMLLTVGVLGAGLLSGRLPVPRKTQKLDKLIGLHFGALLLATVFSDAPIVSAKYLATMVLYVAFGYGVPRVLGLQRSEWMRAVGAIAAGTVVLVAYVLTQQALQGISYQLSYTIAQPFLEHAHTNLTVMLEPLVLLLNLALLYHPFVQRTRVRVLTTAVLTGVLMVVAFSYSRASYVSLSAQALLLLANAGWAIGRRILLPWAVSGLFILAAWQVVEGVHPNASQPSDPKLLHELSSVSDFSPANESNAERKSRWLFSIDLYQQEPVVGVGPGTFPDRYLDFVRHSPSHPTYYTTLRRMNAHNLYLDWLVEAGALGFATGVMLLGYLVWRQLRWAFRWSRTPGRVGFTVYFLFFLLHSLTQDFWQEPRVMVAFWLAVGLQRFYEKSRVSAASAAAVAA
ncbi:O-antigen ligase family protein [Hymenobacter sedentarius]|uniref:O-antigen ligase family protein n=1 Tax=Hymenobacter sedentarius TaxID=1411621 RepID=UPI0009E8F3B0|nr:O-antigen ligase family protein [Hymenobacter sedentarius]